MCAGGLRRSRKEAIALSQRLISSSVRAIVSPSKSYLSQRQFMRQIGMHDLVIRQLLYILIFDEVP